MQCSQISLIRNDLVRCNSRKEVDRVIGKTPIGRWQIENINGGVRITNFYEQQGKLKKDKEDVMFEKTKEEYKIKLPKNFFDKLKQVEEMYSLGIAKDLERGLDNTQDSFIRQMLEQDLWRILDDKSLSEIAKANIDIMDYFKIDPELTNKKKLVILYHDLLVHFTDNIGKVEKAYEEVLGSRDIEKENIDY